MYDDNSDQATFELFAFTREFYPPELAVCIEAKFDRHRRAAAKFWDEQGMKLVRGELRLGDIAFILKSRAMELQLLVFLEVAHTIQEQWETGPGKHGLFYLAAKAQELPSDVSR